MIWEIGKGYFVALPGGFGETRSWGIAGTIHSGDLEVSVTKNTDGFNVLSNPYTSAISVTEFFLNENNADNTTGVVYFWDDGGQNNGDVRAGDYVTVNSMGTIGTNSVDDGVSGLKGTSIYDGYILTQQGFMVEATNNGVVSFTPAMQTTFNNEDYHFYRKATDQRTKIKLSINGENLYNETLIGFDENATWGKDYSLDATKLKSESEISFYSVVDEEDYAILALPVTDEEVNVQLGFDLRSEGNFNITVQEMINTDVFAEVILTDHLTGNQYDLYPESSIRFSSAAVSNDLRFTLTLVPLKVLSTGYALESGQLALVKGNSGTLTMNYTNGDHGVAIYDLSGKTIFNQKVEFEKEKASISPRLETNKVYMIRVNDQSIKFKLSE